MIISNQQEKTLYEEIMDNLEKYETTQKVELEENITIDFDNIYTGLKGVKFYFLENKNNKLLGYTLSSDEDLEETVWINGDYVSVSPIDVEWLVENQSPTMVYKINLKK